MSVKEDAVFPLPHSNTYTSVYNGFPNIEPALESDVDKYKSRSKQYVYTVGFPIL